MPKEIHASISTPELNTFAHWVAKAVESYFDEPNNKRRFEEWLKQEEQ